MQQTTLTDDDELDLVAYWYLLLNHRRLIGIVTAMAMLLGGAYAVFARPFYEANLLIQVEDANGSASSLLGDAATLLEAKTPATAEIEIIRSRMILGKAVDNTLLYVEASPRYLPFVGHWLARRSNALSEPGLLGFGGYIYGNEGIRVKAFSVPQELEGTTFRVTAGQGEFRLSQDDLGINVRGRIGQPLSIQTPVGSLELTLSELTGKAGAQFDLIRRSRLATIEQLQQNLRLIEKGRQSGVIDASLQGSDPLQLTAVLNEIGTQYVRQNIERKAAEAQKTLAFLDTQLPQFKSQLDIAEEAYNRYRNQQGTVALDEEARLLLSQIVSLNGKLVEAQQRRRELVARFTPEHPAIQTLDAQISAWNSEIAKMEARVRQLPNVQQSALRLERDVKVNNDLYNQLRNNALQLQLVREGKIGNVRLIDEATVPEVPVQPRRSLVLAASLIAGLFLGILLALIRHAFFRGLRDAQEIEMHSGLAVYSTIPLSGAQSALAQLAERKSAGIHVLAEKHPSDPAVESLRSLRTAIQFTMLEAENNRLLITGPTPSLGKSFISVNFAAIMASAGKRVLLIDADLRKGYLNQYFGVPRSRGLSELIAGTGTIETSIRQELLPNLDLLTTGILPPNPAEMMQSASVGKVLEELSTQYDLVIVDTPPVLVAADTASVASHMGTVLLVARAGQTQLGEIQESAKRLAQVGRAVSGVLFNAVDLTRRQYGGGRYSHYSYQHYNYGQRSE